MIGRYALGEGLFVPSRVALLLVEAFRLDLNAARVSVRERDPEVAAVLASWAEVVVRELTRNR